MNPTKDFIEQIVAAFQQPPLAYEIVSKYGHTWEKAEHISGWEKQMCFKNSLHLAQKEGWLYAEGWSTAGKLFPLEHAWCVKPDGTIVDSTWNNGSHYYGVVFDVHMAANLVAQTGYYGILPNLFLLARKVPDVRRWIVNSLSPRYSDGSFH